MYVPCSFHRWSLLRSGDRSGFPDHRQHTSRYRPGIELYNDNKTQSFWFCLNEIITGNRFIRSWNTLRTGSGFIRSHAHGTGSYVGMSKINVTSSLNESHSCVHEEIPKMSLNKCMISCHGSNFEHWWLPARGAPCTCSDIYLPDKTKCHLHSWALLGTWWKRKRSPFLSVSSATMHLQHLL